MASPMPYSRLPVSHSAQLQGRKSNIGRGWRDVQRNASRVADLWRPGDQGLRSGDLAAGTVRVRSALSSEFYLFFWAESKEFQQCEIVTLVFAVKV